MWKLAGGNAAPVSCRTLAPHSPTQGVQARRHDAAACQHRPLCVWRSLLHVVPLLPPAVRVGAAAAHLVLVCSCLATGRHASRRHLLHCRSTASATPLPPLRCCLLFATGCCCHDATWTVLELVHASRAVRGRCRTPTQQPARGARRCPWQAPLRAAGSCCAAPCTAACSQGSSPVLQLSALGRAYPGRQPASARLSPTWPGPGIAVRAAGRWQRSTCSSNAPSGQLYFGPLLLCAFFACRQLAALR